VGDIERVDTKIMMNLANPEQAYSLQFIPNDGVGLVRMEFIVSNHIRVHPMALLRPDKLQQVLSLFLSRHHHHNDDERLTLWRLMVVQHEQEEIKKLIKPCREGKEYFVRTLAQGTSLPPLLSLFSGPCWSLISPCDVQAWARSVRRSTRSASSSASPTSKPTNTPVRVAHSPPARPPMSDSVWASCLSPPLCAGLLGGKHFEPDEENPMLGWRCVHPPPTLPGASNGFTLCGRED
jgi:phosphoenolpyruvate synthase/pyruvate phosphate dikinase